jgi:hypothetical protein
LSVAPEPLSKPLEDFVKKDGWNFEEELQRAATTWDDIEYDMSGDIPRSGWDNQPPDYDQDNDWNSMSAQQYHSKHARHDSNLSSATLTPNTEHDANGLGVQEMVEINGGMDASTGVASSASSSTIAGDAMDVDGTQHGRASFTDTEMTEPQDEPRVQHIEIAEKKGG